MNNNNFNYPDYDRNVLDVPFESTKVFYKEE